MRSVLAHQPHAAQVRPAQASDLAALTALEQRAFATDRISRKSFRRLLGSRHAATLVAEIDGKLAGYALVLFREQTGIARLYSIAVAPEVSGRRLGPTLLEAAEQAALARGAGRLRLEVHEANARAIALYRRLGYREFGRHPHYYEDKGHALRFEKRLVPDSPRLRDAPPYFHQTTEFTCGPACMMMALAWAAPRADRKLQPAPAFEFELWREATTIFGGSGPGGCEPYGMAVALKRRGLAPEVYVSRPG